MRRSVHAGQIGSVALAEAVAQLAERATRRATASPVAAPQRISAAFATARDADTAIRMISTSAAIDIVGYHQRPVIGEQGDIQMVMLDVDLRRPDQASRVETCILGAHGVRLQGA